jgi:hypothetical protein
MHDQMMIGGKPLAAWNAEWMPLDGGLRVPHPELRGQIGLFRTILRGDVMYLGCATEGKNRGLRKRLSDFVRPSENGRRHHAGELIHRHRDQVQVEVLIVGENQRASVIARQLKNAFLAEARPSWNVPV